LSQAQRRERVRLVFSCAGIEHVRDVKPVPHPGFRVGYIGTVDACKMHPAFLQLSASARIPDVEFLVCGGDRHKELGEAAARLGLGDRFRFLGPVRDIRDPLSTFDVFGYPLHRQHYGTGEQVLIEAMAAGVPPVVLGPGAESYVVHHGQDGLVVEDSRDYGRALELLWRDRDLRRRLGDRARQTARREYTIERTAAAWRAVFDEVLARPKRVRRWRGSKAHQRPSAAELFCASLGEHAKDFDASLHDNDEGRAADERIAKLPYVFRTPTRGTPFHYRRFFRHDPHLRRWCHLLSSPDVARTAGWSAPGEPARRAETDTG
jgi:hypothetical protein